MQEFPQDFNKKFLQNMLKGERVRIVYEAREKIYKAVINKIKNGIDIIKQKLPTKIDYEGRKDLVEELVGRFGVVWVKGIDKEHKTKYFKMTRIEDIDEKAMNCEYVKIIINLSENKNYCPNY